MGLREAPESLLRGWGAVRRAASRQRDESVARRFGLGAGTPQSAFESARRLSRSRWKQRFFSFSDSATASATSKPGVQSSRLQVLTPQ